MSTTYRIDYIADSDTGAVTTIGYGSNRRGAFLAAATKSRKYGAAYAIASDDTGDTGQRVYYDGAYSHQDDA